MFSAPTTRRSLLASAAATVLVGLAPRGRGRRFDPQACHRQRCTGE